MKEVTIITRYSAPGEYDQFPEGTLCKVIDSLSAGFHGYLQTEVDEINPRWEYLGYFKEERDMLNALRK